MAASGNIHPGKTSMFEPVHGSAPPIAGRNIANPFGAILTAAMMLGHLGLVAEAARIEGAVLEAVRQKKTTQDIGGTLGTREAGEWVAGGSCLRLTLRWPVDSSRPYCLGQRQGSFDFVGRFASESPCFARDDNGLISEMIRANQRSSVAKKS